MLTIHKTPATSAVHISLRKSAHLFLPFLWSPKLFFFIMDDFSRNCKTNWLRLCKTYKMSCKKAPRGAFLPCTSLNPCARAYLEKARLRTRYPNKIDMPENRPIVSEHPIQITPEPISIKQKAHCCWRTENRFSLILHK